MGVLDAAANVWSGWNPERLTVLTSLSFPALDFASVPHPLDGQPLSSHYDPLEQPGGLADWLETPRERASKAPEFTTTLHQSLRPEANGITYQGAAWMGMFDLRSSGLMSREHFPGRATPETALENAPETAPEVFSHFEAIPPLPQTLPQVLDIARTLHALEPQVFVGAAASLVTLRSVLHGKAPKILHLTTHGVQLGREQYEAASPEVQDRLIDPLQRSYLFFAGAGHANHTTWSGPGLLSAFELAGLELRGTWLVVLAACETGLGDALEAEGVSGFSQAAFLARATLTTLWRVEVNATTALMQDFYTAWQKVNYARPAQVLTQLKRRWLEQGIAPFYWAAFTLSGR